MKKILLAILCVAGGLSLQSCLHDDTEFFDTPAANRIENTVENTQRILESAPNGWEMHYYCGKDYVGGALTYLLKFKDGKVTVAADAILSTPEERATSSYTVDRSMGPVISLNTYNELFHQLSTPSLSYIQGAQADWEFVVTRLTEDSIYVKGKKWDNDMVLTRMPEDTDWTAYLQSLTDAQKQLSENYSITIDGGKTQMVEVNNSTRRLSTRDNNDKVVDVPFYTTPTGVHAMKPLNFAGVETADLDITADGNLAPKGQKTVELNPYFPTIDDWLGNWSLNCMSGACDIDITKTTTENMLKGTFTVDGYTYAIDIPYDPETGMLNFTSQEIEDPSETYSGIWFMNADLSQGTLLGQGGMNLTWHGVTQEAIFSDDGTLASDGYYTDTFVGVAIDASGSPVRVNGSYVFPFAWYYVTGLVFNNKNLAK